MGLYAMSGRTSLVHFWVLNKTDRRTDWYRQTERRTDSQTDRQRLADYCLTDWLTDIRRTPLVDLVESHLNPRKNLITFKITFFYLPPHLLNSTHILLPLACTESESTCVCKVPHFVRHKPIKVDGRVLFCSLRKTSLPFTDCLFYCLQRAVFKRDIHSYLRGVKEAHIAFPFQGIRSFLLTAGFFQCGSKQKWKHILIPCKIL